MNKQTTESGEQLNQEGEAEADERPPPPPKDMASGMAIEMKRQMEAARERMKKYHAVYQPQAEEPGS